MVKVNYNVQLYVERTHLDLIIQNIFTRLIDFSFQSSSEKTLKREIVNKIATFPSVNARYTFVYTTKKLCAS